MPLICLNLLKVRNADYCHTFFSPPSDHRKDHMLHVIVLKKDPFQVVEDNLDRPVGGVPYLSVVAPSGSNDLDFHEGFFKMGKLFELVMILLGFCVLFAFQDVFDSTFYGLGKTNYILFESVITNIIYYGTAFILYLTGIWVPTLTGIAVLFGIGNGFDSIVSFGAYVFLLRKQRLSISPAE